MRTRLTVVVNGLDADPTTGAVKVDRFLYTSRHDARESGYRVVARSPGLQDAEAVEASVTFGLLGTRLAIPGFERYPTTWMCFQLRSTGRMCVGRLDDAGRDGLARPGRFAVTGLVLTPEDYQRVFCALPPTRSLLSLDPDGTPPVLTQLVLRAGVGQPHHQRTDEAVQRLLAAQPETVTALLVAAERAERIVVTSSLALADDLIAVLRLLPPAERRVSLLTTAFAWGKLCDRFSWIGSPRALLEQGHPPEGVRVVDWQAPRGPGCVAGRYASEVERLLRTRDAEALRGLLRDLERLDPLPATDLEVQAYFAYLRARSRLDRGIGLEPLDAAAAIPGSMAYAEDECVAQLHTQLVLSATAHCDREALLALARQRRSGATTVRPCVREGMRAAFEQLVASRRWLAATVLLGEVTSSEHDRLVDEIEAWAHRVRPGDVVELLAEIVHLRAAGAWGVADGATIVGVLDAALSALERRGALAQAEASVLALAELAPGGSSTELELALRCLERVDRHARAAGLLVQHADALSGAPQSARRLLAAAPSGALGEELETGLVQLAFGGGGGPSEVARRVQEWAERPRVSPTRLADVLCTLGEPEVAGAVLAATGPLVAPFVADHLRTRDEPLFVSALACVGPRLVQTGKGGSLVALLPADGLALGWRERIALWPVDRAISRAVQVIERRRAEAVRQATSDVARAAEADRRKHAEARREAERLHAERLARIDADEQRAEQMLAAQVRSARDAVESETRSAREQALAARAVWSKGVAWRGPARDRLLSACLLLVAAVAFLGVVGGLSSGERQSAAHNASTPLLGRSIELREAGSDLELVAKPTLEASVVSPTNGAPVTSFVLGSGPPADRTVCFEELKYDPAIAEVDSHATSSALLEAPLPIGSTEHDQRPPPEAKVGTKGDERDWRRGSPWWVEQGLPPPRGRTGRGRGREW